MEEVKKMGVNGVSANFDTTFEDLWKQIKGRGEVLPVNVVFRQ